MSYILDALRKADAERERGAVPGLHAQPLVTLPDAAEPPRAAAAPWLWPLAAVVIVLGALFAWRWSATPDATAPAPAVAVATPPALPAALPAAPAAVDAAPLTAPDPAAAQRAILPSVPETRPATRAAPAVAERARAGAPAGPAVAVTEAAPAVAALTPASTAGDGRVVPFAELPEAVRRGLPPLSIAGASYSDHPANRLLIINGNVFHEGDTLAPDLTLDEIKLKSAVLRYKAYRYSVSY